MLQFLLSFVGRKGLHYGDNIVGALRETIARKGKHVKLAVDAQKVQRYFARQCDVLCGGQLGKFVALCESFINRLMSVREVTFVFVFDGMIVQPDDAVSKTADATVRELSRNTASRQSLLWKGDGRQIRIDLTKYEEPLICALDLEKALAHALLKMTETLDVSDKSRLSVRRYYNRILGDEDTTNRSISYDFQPNIPRDFPYDEEYQRFEVPSKVAAAWSALPVFLSNVLEPPSSYASFAFRPLRAIMYAVSLGCNTTTHAPLKLKSEKVMEISRKTGFKDCSTEGTIDILDFLTQKNHDLLDTAFSTMDFWTVTVQDRQRGIITPEQEKEIASFKELWDQHNATIRQRMRGRMGRNDKLQVEELRGHQRNITNKIISIKKGYESPYNKARKALLLNLLGCSQAPVVSLSDEEGCLCMYALAMRSLMRCHAGVGPADVGTAEESSLKAVDVASGGPLLRQSALGGRLDALLLSLCIVRHMTVEERMQSFPEYKSLSMRVSVHPSQSGESFFPSDVVDLQLAHLTSVFENALSYIIELNGVLKKPIAVPCLTTQGTFDLWDGVLAQCVFKQLRQAGASEQGGRLHGKTWIRQSWKAPLALRQLVIADLELLMPAVDPVCPRVVAGWSTALGDIRKKTVHAPSVPDQKQKLKTINWLCGWAESLGVGAIRATVFQTTNQTNWIELDNLRKNEKLKRFPVVFEELGKKHFKKASGKAFMKLFNEKVKFVAESAKQLKAAQGSRERAKLEEPKRRAAQRKKLSKELEVLLDRRIPTRSSKVGYILEQADDMQRRIEVLRDGDRCGAVSVASDNRGDDLMDQKLLRRALRSLVTLRISCVVEADQLLKKAALAKLCLALKDFVSFITGEKNAKIPTTDLDLVRTACKCLKFTDLREMMGTFDPRMKQLLSDVGVLSLNEENSEQFVDFCYEELHKHLDLDAEPSTPEQDAAREHFKQLPFTPNNFQVGMLNGIRNGKSVIATAPTTYGKSFGVLYAAGYTVASSTDDTVVAIVCPTQSLCDQTQAECYGRMKNLKTKPGITLLGTATSYIELDVCTCRVLVCTPDKMEELLLQGWPSYTDAADRVHKRKLAYVIMDEFHDMCSSYGRILGLLDCPFVLLSATIGNSAELQSQLQRLQDVKSQNGWNREADGEGNKENEKKEKKDIKGPEVLLVPEPNTLLRRPVDLLWWHVTPSSLPKNPTSLASIEVRRDSILQMHRLISEEGRSGAHFQHLPALEALQLWQAMYPDKSVPAFDITDPPTKDSRPPIAAVVPTKSMIWKRCDDFRDEFDNMEKDEQDRVMKRLMKGCVAAKPVGNIVSEKVNDDFYENVTSTVIQLNAQKFLPAIFFHLDPVVCRRMLESLLHTLESWEDEYKETSADWKLKVKQSQEAEKANKKALNKKVKDKDANNADEAADNLDMGSGGAVVLDLTAPLPKFCLNITGGRAVETWVDKLCWNRRGQVSWTKDHPLIKGLRRGFGMHLTSAEMTDEREAKQLQRYLNAVEDLFRQKAITTVFSTRSLSLGINMPVRSVCIAGDHSYMSSGVASQMAGRAGRRGLDVEGHVFCLNMSLERATQLMSSPVNEVTAESSINIDSLALARELGGNDMYDRMRLLQKSCGFFGGDDTYIVEEELIEDVADVEEATVESASPSKEEVTVEESDDDWDCGDSDTGIIGGICSDDDDVADSWDA